MTVTDYCSEEDSPMSPEVANLIDFIWNEATGRLSDILAIPVNSIKLEDVEKAEAILLLLRKSLDANEGSRAIQELSDEFFSVIPHKNKGTVITSRNLIAQKQDLCQVKLKTTKLVLIAFILVKLLQIIIMSLMYWYMSFWSHNMHIKD